jgi:hypothetical protein
MLREMPEPGHPMEGLVVFFSDHELDQPQPLLEAAALVDFVE